MALNASVLSAAMRAAFLAEPTIQAIDGPGLTKLCDVISSTVINHIKAAGVVTVPGTGLAAPGGVGGPVTGVAAGTIA